MAWRRTGAKSVFNQWLSSLLTHILGSGGLNESRRLCMSLRLSLFLSVFLSIRLAVFFVSPPVCPPSYTSVRPSVCSSRRPFPPSVCLSVLFCPVLSCSVCLSVLSLCLPLCLSVCLSDWLTDWLSLHICQLFQNICSSYRCRFVWCIDQIMTASIYNVEYMEFPNSFCRVTYTSTICKLNFNKIASSKRKLGCASAMHLF